MSRAAGRLVLLLAVLLPLRAAAREVYLNGVRLDVNTIVKNQKLEGCTVKFDETGNVWITAKGFQVAVTGPAPEPEPVPPEDGKLTKRYFLFAPQKAKGLVQYELDIWVNDVHVKKVRSDDDQSIDDVTKVVRAGKNQVRVVATKYLGEKRVSSSPADVMALVIGEGVAEGARVSIDKTLVSYQRSAAEQQNITEDFSFVGR